MSHQQTSSDRATFLVNVFDTPELLERDDFARTDEHHALAVLDMQDIVTLVEDYVFTFSMHPDWKYPRMHILPRPGKDAE